MDITLEILGIFPSVINDSLYIRIEDDIYYNLAKCINQKLQINFHLLKNIEIFKLKKKQNKINICLCTKNKKTFNELAKTDENLKQPKFVEGDLFKDADFISK